MRTPSNYKSGPSYAVPSSGQAFASTPKLPVYPFMENTEIHEDSIQARLTVNVICKNSSQAVKLQKAIKTLVKSYA